MPFRLDDRSLRRAGLDYWRDIEVRQSVDLPAFEAASPRSRIFSYSACLAVRRLAESVVQRYGDRPLGIPMPAGKVRSLNLAVSVGIVVYEALRQLHHW